MDLIWQLYDQLLWFKDKEGQKTPYMHWGEIEEMDIFSWLDYQIFLLKKGNVETTAKYDSIGL